MADRFVERRIVTGLQSDIAGKTPEALLQAIDAELHKRGITLPRAEILKHPTRFAKGNWTQLQHLGVILHLIRNSPTTDQLGRYIKPAALSDSEVRSYVVRHLPSTLMQFLRIHLPHRPAGGT